MSTAQAVDQAIDDKLAWLRQRQAQISTLPRPVIEAISSPVLFAGVAPDRPVVAVPVLPATTPEVKAHSTKEASFLALANMGLLGLKKGADDVYLVVALSCRAGVADLTRREIRELAEKRFERRIDDSWISARVNELVTAQRVIERPVNRVCTVTGNSVGAVYVVMKQTRMAW